MTNDETIRLLRCFSKPLKVGAACLLEFENETYWPAQAIMSKAQSDGLVRAVSETKIVNSPAVYEARAVLTNAGRVLCGLPTIDEPVTKKAALFD